MVGEKKRDLAEGDEDVLAYPLRGQKRGRGRGKKKQGWEEKARRDSRFNCLTSKIMCNQEDKTSKKTLWERAPCGSRLALFRIDHEGNGSGGVGEENEG